MSNTGSLQSFAPALTHWCFGITILIGLVSSGLTGAEAILAITIAGGSATLSAICSCAPPSAELKRSDRLSSLATFLVIWLDVLANLVAAATCARLASATIDYISKGHFREFLFGLEQHSLGEPWPDVLGVTIILVVTVLFMMGLEKSSTIALLLFLVLLCKFAFFTFIGSFHTVADFQKWSGSFKVHSIKTVLIGSAVSFYSFGHRMPMTTKNNCLKIATLFFMPWLFYSVLATIFSLMTHYRELEGTAIPLIQVFQTRDVDWARPVMAVFTICSVCLLLTEVLPTVYMTFVHLAGKEWRVFVSSLQYQTRTTGAPVLAIFAAGSLAAILAFACPLSHLIKLLSAASLIKCVLVSCQMIGTRYRPQEGDFQETSAAIQYRKLSQNSHQTLKDRLKGFFGKSPQYIHKLSSPKNRGKSEEQECLLFENKSSNIEESEENEMEVMSCSDANSETSADIDVVVEEYRRVTTIMGNEINRPATKLSFAVAIMCLILLVVTALSLPLFTCRLIKFYWPHALSIISAAIILTALPQNPSEISKPNFIPSWLFPFMHSLSIVLGTTLATSVIASVWQGVVFWTIAGLLLYWRCDCCQCDVLEPLVDKATSKIDPHHVIYEFKTGDLSEKSVIVAR
ncbi:solute carrier family 7 member 14 [Euwallacea fornicatus]|uniref:solute carrier family 7 member 14 n=1 Tax=Euwallacea fornicatus TaxID=995702 RepID=UPI0033900FBB